LYYKHPMTSIPVLQKKRGRPPDRDGDYDPIMSLRMPGRLRSMVEKWAAAQDDKLSTSKAICRLIERGLTAANIDALVEANRAAHASKSPAGTKTASGKKTRPRAS
jgi:hypothetical protein